MARSQFNETVAVAALLDGDLDAAAGVEVAVFNRGTTDPAQVYTTPTGGTAFPNPYMTSTSGMVSFWANYGEYDVRFTDTNPSPRFSTYTIGWDAIPYSSLQDIEPAGVVVPCALRRAPTGWLMCDGSAVSRVTYSRLWDALRTDAAGALTSTNPYGNGDGSSTFNVPDLRGRMPMGVDGAAGRISANDAIADTGGVEAVTLADDESPLVSHRHYMADNDEIDDLPQVPAMKGSIGNWVNAGLTPGQAGDVTIKKSNTSLSSTSLVNLSHTGQIDGTPPEAEAHQNMPPYVALNYIIKV